MKNFKQFFEGKNGVLSMPRLTLFLSFWVASYCMVVHTLTYGISADLLGVYVLSYAGSYVGGKWMDNKKDKPDADVPAN